MYNYIAASILFEPSDKFAVCVCPDLATGCREQRPIPSALCEIARVNICNYYAKGKAKLTSTGTLAADQVCRIDNFACLLTTLSA